MTIEGKKGVRKEFILVAVVAIMCTIIWGSTAAAQRNGLGSEGNSYIVAEATTPVETAATIAPTVAVEPVITPLAPAASVEEVAAPAESVEITAEVVESVTEPAEPTEIVEEAVESAATPVEPVIVPAPVAASVEPVAAPAELVVVPVETVVVSEAPVAAPAESVEITTGAAESSLVEFYDAKLNRLYINLDDTDFETMTNIIVTDPIFCL